MKNQCNPCVDQFGQLMAALQALLNGQVANAPYSSEYFICDNGVQKIVRVCFTGCSANPTVAYFDKERQTSSPPSNWNLVSFGTCGEGNPTEGTATIGFLDVNNAVGTVVAGKQSVHIKNVGDANGVVLGTPLFPGETYTFTAYLDPASGIFARSPVIAYDSSGTDFHISTVN